MLQSVAGNIILTRPTKKDYHYLVDFFEGGGYNGA